MTRVNLFRGLPAQLATLVGHATLMRRFVVISLVSIGPATLLFGWLTGAYLTRSSLDREKSVTVEHVDRLVARSMTAEHWQDLSRLDSRARIAALAGPLLDIPEVVRVKVFDATGTVIWSDEPATVGLNFGHDDRIREALVGQVVVGLERMRPPQPENVFEAARYDRLTTVYVPVTDPATGRVRAVFELYKTPDLFLETIRNGQLALWCIAAVTGAMLWLTQLVLVSAASKTLGRQRMELEARARALEAANAELVAAHRQLTTAERLAAVGEVTVAVAHGLRSPLANVRAVAQEALEGLRADDPAAEPLREIVTEVDRLEARLRGLLRSTRPFELNATAEKPEAIIEDVLGSIARTLAACGARVEQQIDEPLPEACWDQPKIEQAIQEVLANSLEAGARRIVLRARAKRESERAMIGLEIEDDGSGLTAAARAQAFDPFFTTKRGGTGVGLTGVRRIVEAHGGDVSIEPGREGGARVTLRLPCRAPMGA